MKIDKILLSYELARYSSQRIEQASSLGVSLLQYDLQCPRAMSFRYNTYVEHDKGQVIAPLEMVGDAGRVFRLAP